MTLEFWRNLSVVWISIHLFLLCLVPLGILFFVVQGMNWALGRTSHGFQRLQEASGKTRAKTEETAAKVTTAVVQGQGKAEKARATLRQLLRRAPAGPLPRQGPGRPSTGSLTPAIAPARAKTGSKKTA